jgi:hypothetical protein
MRQACREHAPPDDDRARRMPWDLPPATVAEIIEARKSLEFQIEPLIDALPPANPDR